MVKIKNCCCDCATPAYPCLGASCPNRNVEVHYCDECKKRLDEDEIYEADGEELCFSCFAKRDDEDEEEDDD